jgi:hypothetical protein
MRSKIIQASIFYEVNKNNCHITVRKSANLVFDHETSLAMVRNFVKDFEAILAAFKNCAKHDRYCVADFSVLECHTEDDGRISSDVFDRWEYKGFPSREDGGILFEPDKKFTESYRDFWIGFNDDVLKSLSGLDF